MESTSSSIIDETAICPVVQPTTPAIDPNLISDVLAMRPTLVYGRARAQTAEIRRRSARYRSLQHTKRPYTAGGKLFHQHASTIVCCN